MSLAGTVAAFLFAASAQAQSPEEFYKGKTVVLYSGHSAAGAYSAYARMPEPVAWRRHAQGANSFRQGKSDAKDSKK